MRAVYLTGGRISVVTRKLPPRLPRHALVRVIAAGICNTDLELQRGYYRFRGTPGHEFVGEVVECHDAAWRGRRVVGEINLACGTCAAWCRRGLGRHCPRRTVLGIVKHPGAFAEYLTLPIANLHAVPAAMPTEHAVFTEPVAAACEILDQVAIARGQRVAVVGDGKLGLLIAQVLQLHGARVAQFGHHRHKLRITARLGVETHVALARFPKAAFDCVVEATGSADGLRTAIAMARPRGTVVMKSTVHGPVSLDAAPIIVPELTLVGSRCGRFEPALRLIASGRMALDAMISDQFGLEEAPRAFARAAEKGVLKVLLRP